MAIDIKFGTDGWRGVIAEDYTFDNVRRCARSTNKLQTIGSSAGTLVASLCWTPIG